MPPRTSSTTGKQQTKLSFVSSKSSAAASRNAKAAILGKTAKALVKKEEPLKDEIEASEIKEEDKRGLDDIESPSSEDENEETIKTAKNLERPMIEKREPPKTTQAVKTTRSTSGTRKVSGTTAAAEAVAEKVAKIKQESELDVSSRAHLDVKDPAYSELSNKASQQLGFLAPIHAEDQNRIHKILRVFDLSYEFGPTVGMTRLERWERAKALGLNPPTEIYDILSTQEGLTQPAYTNNVFAGQV